MEKEENKLVVVVKESGLEETQSKAILDTFDGFFKEAIKWELKAKKIKVTSITQIKEMSEAREIRLALKNIRTNAEKARKNLKEKIVREGKAIDGIANVIKALIVPLEQHLEIQEKFREKLEEEQKKQLILSRQNKLLLYMEEDQVVIYNLGELSEEAFNNLLNTSKFAYEAKIAAEKKAEEDRIAAEKAEKAEKERIKKENEKLLIELQKEKEAKEKLQKELKDKEILELKKKAANEAKVLAEKEAKEKAEREAKLAPEKDKLFAWSEEIKSIQVPTDLSKAGFLIVKEVEEKLLKISQEIKLKIKNL